MKKRGCSVGNIAISCVYLAIVLLLLSSSLATSSQVTTGYGGKWGVRTLMQDGEGDDGSTYHSRCKRGDVTGSCTRGDGTGDTKT
ncbi:hypothetical protein N665_0017s0022 [Sinapis alba]|nr:hypothetical protein N665_0017s0022 [Sinapis alba]